MTEAGITTLNTFISKLQYKMGELGYKYLSNSRSYKYTSDLFSEIEEIGLLLNYFNSILIQEEDDNTVLQKVSFYTARYNLYALPYIEFPTINVLFSSTTTAVTGDTALWSTYTAVSNVSLGDYNISNVGSLQFSGGSGDQGTLSWNTEEETIDVIQNGSVLQLGLENHHHVRNNSGSQIDNGTVVMATGSLGASSRITVAPWDGTANIKYILGITTYDIPNGEDGKVTWSGKVRGVDTGAIAGTFTDGVIYAKTDGTGGLTYDKPTSGQAIALAFLVSAETAPSANNGVIEVRTLPFDENIFLGTTNNGVLTYNSATGQAEVEENLTFDGSEFIVQTSSQRRFNITDSAIGLSNTSNEVIFNITDSIITLATAGLENGIFYTTNDGFNIQADTVNGSAIKLGFNDGNWTTYKPAINITYTTGSNLYANEIELLVADHISLATAGYNGELWVEDNYLGFYTSSAGQIEIGTYGFTLQKFATDPLVVQEGSIFYNTTDKAIKLYNGTAWKEIIDWTSATENLITTGQVLGERFYAIGTGIQLESSGVVFWQSGINSLTINAASVTGVNTVTVPDKSGTIALLSDISGGFSVSGTDTNGSIITADGAGGGTRESTLTFSSSVLANISTNGLIRTTNNGNNQLDIGTLASSNSGNSNVATLRSIDNSATGRPALEISGSTSVDSGTDAVIEFIALNGVSSFATRPLFSWHNYTTKVTEIAANGNWDFQTNKLTNIADPTSTQDAATKNYVDNKSISQVQHDEQTGITTTTNVDFTIPDEAAIYEVTMYAEDGTNAVYAKWVMSRLVGTTSSSSGIKSLSIGSSGMSLASPVSLPNSTTLRVSYSYSSGTHNIYTTVERMTY